MSSARLATLMTIASSCFTNSLSWDPATPPEMVGGELEETLTDDVKVQMGRLRPKVT